MFTSLYNGRQDTAPDPGEHNDIPSAQEGGGYRTALLMMSVSP